MHTYIALLRAVNVGGTGKLKMADLRALCEAAGYREVRTYIQSGNVVLASPGTAAEVKLDLEARLAAHMGKPVGVLVRTPDELVRLVEAVPWPEAPGNRVMALFLDDPPAADLLEGWAIPGGEALALAEREVLAHFPDGMGRTKLKLPHADRGTARNLNTVRKLIELADAC